VIGDVLVVIIRLMCVQNVEGTESISHNVHALQNTSIFKDNSTVNSVPNNVISVRELQPIV